MAASSKAPVLGAVIVAITAAVVVVVLACGRAGDDVRVSAPGSPACAALPVALDDAWHPAARRALLARNPRATTSAAWLADVIDAQLLALLELIGGAQLALGQIDDARRTRERARQIALVEPAPGGPPRGAAPLDGSAR